MVGHVDQECVQTLDDSVVALGHGEKASGCISTLRSASLAPIDPFSDTVGDPVTQLLRDIASKEMPPRSWRRATAPACAVVMLPTSFEVEPD